MKTELTTENKEKYQGFIKAEQRHIDGNFLIVDYENYILEQHNALKKSLIKKGTLTDQEIKAEMIKK